MSTCVICFESDDCCLFGCKDCTAEYCLQCLIIISKSDDTRCSCCRRELIVSHGDRDVTVGNLPHRRHRVKCPFIYAESHVSCQSMSTNSSVESDGPLLRGNELNPVNELLRLYYLQDSDRIALKIGIPEGCLGSISMERYNTETEESKYECEVIIPIEFKGYKGDDTEVLIRANIMANATLYDHSGPMILLHEGMSHLTDFVCKVIGTSGLDVSLHGVIYREIVNYIRSETRDHFGSSRILSHKSIDALRIPTVNIVTYNDGKCCRVSRYQPVYGPHLPPSMAEGDERSVLNDRYGHRL
jgi:hypothetical protein